MKSPLRVMMRSLLVVSMFVAGVNLRAQGTAFTYQGLLDISNSPATGSYDLSFQLYNASTPTNTAAVGSPVALTNIPVSNGLFSVSLNFGAVFNGSNYWVQISAATNGDTNLSALSPLLPITPTPYAISASNLLGTLPVSQLSGTILPGQLATNVVTNTESGVTLSGTFSGNGSGLTGVTAGSVAASNITGIVTNVSLSGVYPNAVTFSNLGNVFVGDGSGLTNLTAASFSGVLSNGSLAGVYTNAVTFSNISNVFVGDGYGLTNVNVTSNNVTLITYTTNVAFVGDGSGLTNLSADAVSGSDTNMVTFSNTSDVFVGSGAGLSNLPSWSLTGNAGTTPGVNFIGTTDTNTLEFHVNGRRALLLDGSYDPDQPNVVSGDYRNTITYGVYGATIAGGHGNLITTNSSASEHSTIGGGNYNLISNNNNATISGGDHNTIENGSDHSTIGGGYENWLVDAPYAFIGGGSYNWIGNATNSVIVGGDGNYIDTYDNDSSIGGGATNYIGYYSVFSTIGGGYSNNIYYSEGTVIGGGVQNTTGESILYGTIPGGFSNLVTENYTFAAGQQAQAVNQGAFVWADSQNAPFASTNDDSFNVRAQGGVNFSTSGAALTVTGPVVATGFSGSGAGLTGVTAGSVAASNITGIVSLAQLPAAVVTNDGSGVDLSGSFAGDGSGLTNLNASQLTGGPWVGAYVAGISNTGAYVATNTFTGAGVTISSNAHWTLVDETGTIYETRTNGRFQVFMTNGNSFLLSNGSLTLASNGVGLSYSQGSLTVSNNATVGGNLVVSGLIYGTGANLSGLTATNLTGTVPVTNLPVATSNTLGVVEPDGTTIVITNGVLSSLGGGSVPLNGTNVWTGTNTFTSTVIATNGVSNTFAGAFIGDGSGLTNVTASSFSTNFVVSDSSAIVFTNTQNSYVGSGAGLTNLPITGTAVTTNASPYGLVINSIGGGGVQTNSTNIWTGTNTFTSTVIATNGVSNQFAGAFIGDGSQLTNLSLLGGTNITLTTNGIFVSINSSSGSGGSVTNITVTNATGTAGGLSAATNGGTITLTETVNTNVQAASQVLSNFAALGTNAFQPASTILSNITSPPLTNAALFQAGSVILSNITSAPLTNASQFLPYTNGIEVVNTSASAASLTLVSNGTGNALIVSNVVNTNVATPAMVTTVSNAVGTLSNSLGTAAFSNASQFLSVNVNVVTNGNAAPVGVSSNFDVGGNSFIANNVGIGGNLTITNGNLILNNGSVNGSGSGLFGVPGSGIQGPLNYSTMSALLAANNTWAETNTFTSTLIATNASATSEFSGLLTNSTTANVNGSGITNISPTNFATGTTIPTNFLDTNIVLLEQLRNGTPAILGNIPGVITAGGSVTMRHGNNLGGHITITNGGTAGSSPNGGVVVLILTLSTPCSTNAVMIPHDCAEPIFGESAAITGKFGLYTCFTNIVSGGMTTGFVLITQGNQDLPGTAANAVYGIDYSLNGW